MTGAPAFVLDLLVRSTVLLLAAWAAASVVRRCGGSAAMRHCVWLSAIAGLLLLPLLSVTMPALPLAILPEASAPLDSAPAATVASAIGSGQPSSSLPGLILILYAAGAAGMLLWLLAGHRALAQLWHASARADSAWTDLLSRSARDLQLRSHVELRLAPGKVMPMTWGTRTPKILLPAEASLWSPTRSRFVLLHELGHVRRCDSLTQAAAALVRAIYWFHPGAWFAARQLRLEQELAADDLALGAGISPNGYARNLLELACAFCLPAPAMARRSQLEQRLAAIIRPTGRQAPGLGFGTLAATLVLAATWLAATATPVARATASLPPVAVVVAPPAEASSPLPVAAPEAAPAPIVPAQPARIPTVRLAMTAPAPSPPVAAPVIQPVAPIEMDQAAKYARDLARYRQEKAEYEVAVGAYRLKRAAYVQDVEQYRRELADHRRQVAAIRALPDQQHRPAIPPAPVAPVAPVVPTVPAVPAVPANLHNR